MEHKELAFLVTRISLGVNFLMHGLVRLPKLQQAAQGMAENYQDTVIGFAPLIQGYTYALTFAEILIGLAILIGFKTKYALAACSLTLTTLIFGSCLKENWGAVGTQMVYVIVVYLLLWGYTSTKYSVDAALQK